MEQVTIRLQPGQDLKEEIQRLAKARNIRAGIILSIVGGLSAAVLRMAGSEPDHQIIKEWNEPLEIVSGTGTVSKNGSHIHIAVSNQEGEVIGGHLKKGCLVKFTGEIVIGVFEDVTYSRIMDSNTGFKELEVQDHQ